MSGTMTFDAAPSCETPDRCRFAVEMPMRQQENWQALYDRQGRLTNPRKNEMSVRCTICGKTFVQEMKMAAPYAPPAPAVPPPTAR